MANLRNTLLLSATCVSLALSSAAFSAPTKEHTTTPAAMEKDASADASTNKMEHKKMHKAKKTKKAKKEHNADMIK